MKKVFYTILIILGLLDNINAQFANTTTQGSPSTLINSKGGLIADSAFVISRIIFSDTASANFSVASKYSGSVIQVSGGQVWYRTLNPNKWNLFALAAALSISQGIGIVNTPNPISTVGGVALDTAYTNATYVRIQTQNPTSSLSGGASYELHSAGTFGATLNWSAGRYAANATQAATNPLSSIVVASVSQSFSQPSAGSSVSGTQSVTVTYNSNTTYNNVVTTTDGKTATSSTSFNFYAKEYIGFTTSSSPNDAAILAATGGTVGGFFATSYNASGSLSAPSSSSYICIAYPASFGTVNSIMINGLAVTFNLTVRSLTNASGYSQQYNVYVSPNPSAGSISSYSVN